MYRDPYEPQLAPLHFQLVLVALVVLLTCLACYLDYRLDIPVSETPYTGPDVVEVPWSW